MEIEQQVWGFTPGGEAVILYTMRNASGAEVRLTNLGAAVVSIIVPDRAGNLADVVLGYGKFENYMNDSAAFGKTVGRYANRIARGIFTLDGQEYRLAQNNPPNHLHGGPDGFANRIWEGRVETNRVVFALISPDGDQNYPGELSVEVIYDWDDDNVLDITLQAHADAPTIVNLTNHTYFNLAGESSGSVLDQILQLDASRWLPTDATLIPTGELVSVVDTPMDFRQAKPIGRDIDADFEALNYGGGYDHCWVIDGWEPGKMTENGTLYDPVSGRAVTFSSTQPGVQVYTGNYLQGTPAGKSGRPYANRDGVAIECQGFPDAPNHADFPSQRLGAGEIYREQISMRFTVR